MEIGGKRGLLFFRGGEGGEERGKTSIRSENQIGKKERKKEVWSRTSSEDLGGGGEQKEKKSQVDRYQNVEVVSKQDS